MIIGELIYSANHGPDRYILHREGTINQFTQRVGLGNSYCNYLAICRYFFQIKTFLVVDKYIFLTKSLIIVQVEQTSMLCHTLLEKNITLLSLQLSRFKFFIGLNERSCQELFNRAIFFLQKFKLF